MNAKRLRFYGAAVLAALLLAVVGVAQDADTSSPDILEALKQGHLTVWVVVQAPSLGRLPKQAGVAVYKTPTPGYHESTTGNLGQDAANYGQTAGSYGVDSGSTTISAPTSPTAPQAKGSQAGDDAPANSGYKEQTSGSFGQTSGGYGQTAGSYGQTSGSLGEPAGNVGTSAGNYGQTVGSFGNSLGTIADAGTNMAKRTQGLGSTPQEDEVRSRLAEAFPDLSVGFTTVPVEDLASDLRGARGTPKYPDVLMGVLPKQGLIGGPALAMLQQAGAYDDGVTDTTAFSPEFLVLVSAPHQKAARAFAAWVAEAGEGCRGCVAGGLTKDERAAADVAVDAVKRLLRGENLGNVADVAMAPFPPNLGRAVLLTNEDRSANVGDAQVEVVKASVNGRLGVVTLRVVPSSNGVLGVAHPLVILRRGVDRKWRVLHVSLNLPAVEAESERTALMESCTDRICGTKGVLAVSVAEPADGALRQPMPQLWWDNGGGSRLEVVEWEESRQGEWSDARLYLVPDRDAKLRTQVMASFARRTAQYRWRVWSVGMGGEVKITSWRTFKVEP